ncbi:hypothetical protein FOCC_FOCC006678 [Frankliniella occidentalis]|nr:hypothetical protein FOCC_FOCC006678 [Frankliniella occidentalis]
MTRSVFCIRFGVSMSSMEAKDSVLMASSPAGPRERALMQMQPRRIKGFRQAIRHDSLVMTRGPTGALYWVLERMAINSHICFISVLNGLCCIDFNGKTGSSEGKVHIHYSYRHLGLLWPTFEL